MISKELELICILYENEELKISDIAKKLGISNNSAKKLIDVLSKEYAFNIFFDKKKRTYSLLQNKIEKHYTKVEFWKDILMYIFYIFSKSEEQKLKNLAVTLFCNFFKFCKNSHDSKSAKFFDEDMLFIIDDASLFYVKEMDYNLFIKVKSAISNKNEIRVTVVDRLNSGFKRVNMFPIYLAFIRKNWYLIGFSENEYIVFDINDIKEIFLTGRVWEGDVDVSLDDAIPEIREYIIPNKKYSVLIDISDYVKIYGIGFLHPSQKIIRDKDRVLLQLEIVNLSMLFRWLSSYGRLMKIVEPEIVKQKYIDYLMDIVDSYS
ncbi:MAG: WYL domain-containing transcriptional regulator [Candidatus Calescibacterium sp.]|nr:WYL domain-containing transcriptional regulator [Candidatus Calescibacterium sp.]MDW8133072.1 WYL domain-containing transcriptional regulator [Candidatus Calescibacterium sp.]